MDEHLIALAWHDVTCPEGPECRDRNLHALGDPMITTGTVARFLHRLGDLELEANPIPKPRGMD